MVHGRSDRQLDWLFGSGPGQALIFRGMERSFHSSPVDATQGTLQYHLNGRAGTRSWVVRVGGGRLVAEPGVEPNAGATLRMAAATFARLAAGQQTAGSAAMRGELQMEGNLRLVAHVGALLGQPPL